jgi:pimeloyl-ACP methyl ester carboxylesterase
MSEPNFSWPDREPAIWGHQLQGDCPGGVFLHGFRSHCAGMKALALASHAASRGRCWLRYNQRHCGCTNAEFARFTISQSIDDAAAILDHVRQPTLLIGSSLGAVVALQCAQRKPAAVSGMLLIAPAVKFVSRHFLTLPGRSISLWQQQGSFLFPDQYEGGVFPLNYTFYEDALEYARLGPWKFDFPVAILHGQQDEILPVEDSCWLRRKITSPCVELDVVPDGDHRLNNAIALMCEKLDALWNLS